MRLFLQPNDTFFFRDGRPFRKGEQSEGYSIFPPLPSTILGALRTAYIAEHGDLSTFYAGNGKLAKIIGTSEPDSLGSIHLKGVFLADKKSNIYYPIPSDLVTKKHVQLVKEKNRLYKLELSPEKSNFISNSPLDQHLRWDKDDDDVEIEASDRLGHLDIRDYLLGIQKTLKSKPFEDFVRLEPKTGIERDHKTLTPKDNMLYRINMSRFQSRFLNTKERKALPELGFVVDYECNIELPENGMLKLGGEGKSFFYRKSCYNPDSLATKEDIKILKEAIRSSDAFKLYFATPAIFKNGWLPKWIDEKTHKGQYLISDTDSISVELVTAAVDKPIAIGGWDMKKKAPKPTRHAVPAGSVYYFKILDDVNDICVDTIVKTFHYKNISDYQAKEGFGLCFVGVAKGDEL